MMNPRRASAQRASGEPALTAGEAPPKTVIHSAVSLSVSVPSTSVTATWASGDSTSMYWSATVRSPRTT